MKFLCEMCYKTFETGVLMYPHFNGDLATRIYGGREFRVLLCHKIFVFSNDNVLELEHTGLIFTGYRQLSHGLRRPLRETNQPNHLLLKLSLSGVKILLLHVT